MVKSQPILRYITRLIPAVAVAVLLSACSATNSAKNMHSETHAVGDKDGYLLQASQDEFEQMVRNLDINPGLWTSTPTGKASVIAWVAKRKAVLIVPHSYSGHSANNLVFNFRAPHPSRKSSVNMSPRAA